MRDIVCLAPDPWQGVPTRTQQLMSRMKGAEVLYFEPPEPRGGKEHKKPGRKMRPGVTVYTLPPIWDVSERQAFRFHRNQRRVADYVLDILNKRNIREPVLWCATPQGVHLLDFLPYRGLVYDCGRYWTGFPPAWESDLAIQADLIFAASEGLKDRLSPCSDNIAVVENGCNFPMFARSDIETPEEAMAAGRPLLGYAGTLWADLDYGPVFTCAAAHPDWWFMLLGRQEDSPGLRRLQTMDHVILADRHPLIEVPDYVGQWDVCMDLRREGSASDVCPGRVFEYLAAGKPVVRHSFPGQLEDFSAGIAYQSDELHGFVAACERAMQEDSPWLRKRRRDAGEHAAWERRSELVRKLMEANMLL